MTDDHPEYLVVKTWKDLSTGLPRSTQPTVYSARDYEEAREEQMKQEDLFRLVFPSRHEEIDWDGHTMTTPSFDVTLYKRVS
jgi:hypothetical protein